MIKDLSLPEDGSDLKPNINIVKKDTDPDSDDDDSHVYCGICRSMAPRYRCPRCNIEYCSLKCYKDEKHADCTENFYKNLVLDEVNSNRPQSSEQNNALLRRLKEWEYDLQTDADGTLGLRDIDGDGDEEHFDLEKRFEDLDIENAEVKAIWERLLPEEQQNFMLLLGSTNPQISELMSAYIPWWEKPVKLVDEVEAPSYPQHIPPLPKHLPDFNRMSQHPPTLPLLYNLLHAVMVYTHIQRHTLGGLQDPELLEPNYEQLGILSRDVLCANARQFMFDSVKDVGIHFGNAIGQTGEHRYKLAMQFIEESMAIFNQPKYLNAALADLHAFTVSTSTTPRTKAARAARIRTMHKVHFYLALALELTWSSSTKYQQLKQELQDDAAVSLQYLADELSNMGRLQDAADYYRHNMP